MTKTTHRRADGTPRSAGGEPPAKDPRVLKSDPIPAAASVAAAPSHRPAAVEADAAQPEAAKPTSKKKGN